MSGPKQSKVVWIFYSLDQDTDKLNLSHHMDYRFFKHDAMNLEKDFLKSANYAIHFNRQDSTAFFSVFKSIVTLRKCLPKKDRMQDFLNIYFRKPTRNEAFIKHKLLSKLDKSLARNFGVKEWSEMQNGDDLEREEAEADAADQNEEDEGDYVQLNRKFFTILGKKTGKKC